MLQLIPVLAVSIRLLDMVKTISMLGKNMGWMCFVQLMIEVT